MKHFICLLLMFLWSATAYSQSTENGPKIDFAETSHNFGEIKKGNIVEWVFKFTNSGKEPLIITNIGTTCGCTATDWPREPIAPGAKNEIKVRFNSANKIGMQNKVVTVYSNAVNEHAVIKIIANVLP